MRACVLSDQEHLWSGFILDLMMPEALPLFDRLRLQAHVTRQGQDQETVHEAWLQYRTIVTANEGHFIRAILEHGKRDSGRTCLDAWGLLVVPPGGLARERLLPKIKNGVPICGEIIPWRAVAYAKLCVSLHLDGSITVRRFRRCAYCEREEPIKRDWYQRLTEIGSLVGGTTV